MNTTLETEIRPIQKERMTLGTFWYLNRGKVGSYIVLLKFAVIYLGSLLMLVNTALKTQAGFMRDATAVATTINFKNFTEAWEKANFPRYLTNSVIYTVTPRRFT
jgi:raffinose/stachyose/melibiose transport system permease protein